MTVELLTPDSPLLPAAVSALVQRFVQGSKVVEPIELEDLGNEDCATHALVDMNGQDLSGVVLYSPWGPQSRSGLLANIQNLQDLTVKDYDQFIERYSVFDAILGMPNPTVTYINTLETFEPGSSKVLFRSLYERDRADIYLGLTFNSGITRLACKHGFKVLGPLSYEGGLEAYFVLSKNPFVKN